MLFNSFEFIIFAIAFFLLWPLFKKRNNSRWGYIVAASFFFYGWWDWRFLFLLIGTGLIDYLAALAMGKWSGYRKLFLWLSVIGNIGTLGVFKYSGFVASNLDTFFAWLGISVNLSANIPSFALILPVGISFYTFQSMSYTIDVFRGKINATRNILHFFSYLALFPQLVAGPILRATDLIPQLAGDPHTTEEDRWEGIKSLAIGFFKKTVLADNLAPAITVAFANPQPPDAGLYWWLITAGFAFQIYFDFSGYSDIAIGLGRIMGYKFMQNFNHPYVSTSLGEFWSRWHISLSTWFRDYVYIPLGGNRKGYIRTLVNITITMIASAIWHGAAWTFVMWGALHTVFLIIERVTGWAQKLEKIKLGLLAWLIVMVQVLASWVFFRAASFAQASEILKYMFLPRYWRGPDIFTLFHVFLILSVLFEFYLLVYPKIAAKFQTNSRLDKFVLATAGVLSITALFAASVFFRGTPVQFIYFQF